MCAHEFAHQTRTRTGNDKRALICFRHRRAGFSLARVRLRHLRNYAAALRRLLLPRHFSGAAQRSQWCGRFSICYLYCTCLLRGVRGLKATSHFIHDLQTIALYNSTNASTPPAPPVRRSCTTPRRAGRRTCADSQSTSHSGTCASAPSHRRSTCRTCDNWCGAERAGRRSPGSGTSRAPARRSGSR